jgi:Protein of unknown function (DUF3383)
MTTGLPTNRVINVTWSLTTAPASYANINTLLVIGDSAVIDTKQRIRSYSSLLGVAADFGNTAPEYLAAASFFAQMPTPQQLYIGRWARTATPGQLVGAALTTPQQALANFTAITAGGFKIKVDAAASPVAVSAINLSSATSLSQVASIITTALASATIGATCTWNGQQFVFTSSTTGASSQVAFLTAPASGSDISALLGGTAALGGYVVAGIAAETPLAAVQALDSVATYWYAASWACATTPLDADYVSVAGYIETTTHIHAITTSESSAITAGNTTDIGSLLMAAAYKRTFGFWSANSPYAAIGALGDLLTTNLDASNTMPTLMWKAIIGAVPDAITTAQANILDGKRYNYYAPFNNGASIIVNGWCFGDAYVDEVYGADWLTNQVQTDLFNLLTSVPKVAQTDKGMTLIANTIEASLERGVNNNYVAPGVWQGPAFGALNTGDQLSTGYYVFIPPIASQSAAARKTRVTPAVQIALKLSGAVDVVSVAITINR